MSGNWYDPGTIGSKRKQLDEQQIQAPPNINAMSGAGMDGGGAKSGIDMSGIQDMGKMPDISDDLKGQGDSQDNKSKVKDGKKEAPKNQRRRMQFMQYMRQENAEDRELVEEFGQAIEKTSDWEREDHLDDLRPSIWFRKDQHVVEVYATLGNLAAVFGILPPVNEGNKQDFTMMKIIFPPVKIPHMVEDEDTGEETEDFEAATDTFKTFIEECADFIKEQSGSRESKPGDRKKPKMAKPPVDEDEDK